MAQAHRSFKLPESKPHYPPPLEFHTAHTKVELAVDFEKKRISGSCTLEIEPIKEGLRSARLDACGLEVAEVKVDGKGVAYEYDGATLEVPLPAGEGKRTIMVRYAASPKIGIYFIGPDKEHPEKEVQAWTHTETEESRYWFPCHDHPGDKSSSELVLTVPKDFRVISNGKLLSSKVEGDRATFHWLEETPHSCYLTSFVAGRFGVITQEARGVPLNYNFSESKREDALRYFGETPKMLEVFEDLTGVKYPYVKYDQSAVQDFVAGGEENLNATTLADNYFPDAASEEDFSVSYSNVAQRPMDLVSHELAHQWFGDYVTCADWPHAWLNEGFASYFQELYVEKTRGTDEMIWHLNHRTQDYFEEDEKEYRRPIVERDYVWPDDLFDSHLYPKGAYRLHELRFVVGDGPFFRGISLYLKSHALSTAETNDLRRAMEKASGMQLEEFFEQAFCKPGHPEFDVAYSWDDATSAATLRVRQTQETEDGTPVFKLPCEVAFYVGGKRESHRVLLDSADQTFTFSLASKPSVVEFDPRGWLLKRVKFDKTVGMLLNQLEQSQDALSRANAAMQLGEAKDPSAVGGLARAAAREQFWHVRASAFRALGDIGTDGALEALLGAGPPKDRHARRGFVAALGNFKDEKAREVLLKVLKEDQSPYVRCEAALSLAKSWPEGALQPLKEAMKVHTVNETLAEACVAAMGKLKEEGAKAIVKESLAYGRPTRVRIGALKAIKERGAILDDEIQIIKEVLLHDKEYRVRQILLATVIKELQDRRLLDALREVSRSDLRPGLRRKALERYHEIAASTGPSEELEKIRGEVEVLRQELRRSAAKTAA
ncbi:MAG: HEAT repeat domain-containing protein [Nitrososphaerota archaeon]|jgi:aminopeptidase N|nr:HEAT repeat domain-containing protein [Nitrososphaerota archaeon]MCL5672779.1 HEAT repeat domain-containing protein [Nitrososphaerota archaeon]MDG6936959.1 HEAT repeat domain-containing protein [Nitrososphaerota archaeon]MDG6945426.1 HEAT repeat domain-containing protein [Nitrososphaerota archaeon]MDG6952106.1 HEAT repeat domain-containing protein [Nitrososphaerota archaeon]